MFQCCHLLSTIAFFKLITKHKFQKHLRFNSSSATTCTETFLSNPLCPTAGQRPSQILRRFSVLGRIELTIKIYNCPTFQKTKFQNYRYSNPLTSAPQLPTSFILALTRSSHAFVGNNCRQIRNELSYLISTSNKQVIVYYLHIITSSVFLYFDV